MIRKSNLTVIFLIIGSHLVFGQGARYHGGFNKSKDILLVDASDLVIEGLEFSSDTASSITLYGCKNVVIMNNFFNTSAKRPAIYLDNCTNITIVDNSFYNVQSGLRAHKSQCVKFEFNDVLNVLGGLRGGEIIGNMVQFDKVYGAGNSISYNVCENMPDESSPEDVINIYSSHGLSGSPIVVKGNWIRGGGPSMSGGGILLGDMGGSFQIAEDNIVINGGQYGMCVAGGDNITLNNNRIFGEGFPHANIGLYTLNWYENQGTSHNITVKNNSVNYTNRDGQLNNWWFAENMQPVKGIESNNYDKNLNTSILPLKIIGRARLEF